MTAAAATMMMMVKPVQRTTTMRRLLVFLPSSSSFQHETTTTLQLGGVHQQHCHQRSLWSRPASTTTTTSSSSRNQDFTTMTMMKKMKPSQRTLVWHAGYLEQEQQAESLADEIRQRQRQMKRLIRELPPSPGIGSSAGGVCVNGGRDGGGGGRGTIPTTTTTATTTTACSSPSPLATTHNLAESLEQILRQEEIILQLCQQYKSLTGEDVADDVLPVPHNDESATVRKMS